MSKSDDQDRRGSRKSLVGSSGPVKYVPPPDPPKAPKGGGVGKTKDSK